MANLKRGHMDSHLLTKLADLRELALNRATNLRKHAKPSTKSELLWMSLALQELDVAHEELRVVEDELHTRADELHATQGALETERRRYHDLFEFAPEPYLITDGAGVVIEGNERACELLGLSGTFLLGKPLAVYVGEQDRPLMRNMLGLLVSTAEVLTFDLRIHARRSKEPVWVKASVRRAPGTAQTSVVLRWNLHPWRASSGTQVDSSAQLEELRRELADERSKRTTAERALLARDEMLAFVAHELRNPLNSAAGWLEIMARDGETPRHHGLDVLTRNVRTLARLAEQLVDQTRVAGSLIVLECEYTDLRALLDRASDDARGVAETKHQHFDCEFAAELPLMRCDAFRVLQALSNVVGNALKFTPSKGSIQLTARVLGDAVEIAVRDTGPGIAPEHLKSIFEPFVRLEAHGASAGLGLGLNIARMLSELHGGSLSVESEGLGRGATFRLRLPIEGPLDKQAQKYGRSATC